MIVSFSVKSCPYFSISANQTLFYFHLHRTARFPLRSSQRVLRNLARETHTPPFLKVSNSSSIARSEQLMQMVSVFILDSLEFFGQLPHLYILLPHPFHQADLFRSTFYGVSSLHCHQCIFQDLTGNMGKYFFFIPLNRRCSAVLSCIRSRNVLD